MNWNPVVLDETTNALHTTDPSDIQVSITDADCKSFEGKGGVAGQYLLINAAQQLDVVSGGMSLAASSTANPDCAVWKKSGRFSTWFGG